MNTLDKTIGELIATFESQIDSARVIETIANLWKYERWFSSKRSDEAAKLCAERLKEMGLLDVELIKLPADGKSYFGGVGMPKCWNPCFGRLEQIAPQSRIIADYNDCPMQLMLYSESTEADGWQGEVVTDESDDVCGKAVLLSEWPSFVKVASLAERGAVGIICDSVFLPRQKEANMAEAIYWHNASLQPFYVHKRPKWGFSISSVQGNILRRELKENKVIVRAEIDVSSEQGALDMLSARIAGQIDEEIVLVGHMYEPGANDNCSGLAVMLEVFRIFQKLISEGKLNKPYRSIRILSSMETRGMQAYVNMYPDLIGNWFAGLCVDMIGSNHEKFPLLVHRQCLENPSFVDGLLGRIIRLACEDMIRWKFAEPDIANDAFIGEPVINVPCPVIHTPEDAYHNNFDVPERLDAETLKRVGITAAVYAWLIACAKPKEIEQMRQSLLCANIELGQKENVEMFSKQSQVDVAEAQKIYPRKLFLGILGIDDMSERQLDRFIALGCSPDWMGPIELNSALCFCDGNNSLYAIWNRIQSFGHRIDLDKLIEHFVLLKERRLVEFW